MTTTITKNVWVTSEIFFECLRRFSSYATRGDQERNVVPLIDNCSAHGSADSMSQFDNVSTKFFPPNTTPKLQPLDSGIIAALKVRYWHRQYEHALNMFEITES